MLKPVYEKRFEKDIKKVRKRGCKFEKLKEVINKLLTEELLPSRNRNHKLKGQFSGYWECHIEPDWLLIYKKTSTTIIFARTGTHSDLF